jgi:hypothetical protein
MSITKNSSAAKMIERRKRYDIRKKFNVSKTRSELLRSVDLMRIPSLPTPKPMVPPVDDKIDGIE